MILYFSATGNSKYCAEYIASRTGDKIISLNSMMKRKESSVDCAGAERLGIIAPVYDWDLAYSVAEYLDTLSIEHLPENSYVYGVFTCGSSAGYSDETLREILDRKGITLNAAFAVSMPDNYVPLFRIESPEHQAKHLASADSILQDITEDITAKRSVRKFTHRPPKIFFRLVRKFAVPFQRKVSGFSVNDNCIGCGLCVNVCPMNIITLKDNRPVWTRDNCACCLSCLHRCPKNAINRGRSAHNGRYINKNVRWQ